MSCALTSKLSCEGDAGKQGSPVPSALRVHFLYVALAAVLSACAPITPPTLSAGADDSAGIKAAAEYFLRVFDDLDWEPFREAWASDPTVFFPFDDTPKRVTGRAEVLARFQHFFTEVRARTPGPPYLHLVPRELRVERFGSAGLVTFMLGAPPGRVSRRTLLFVLEGGHWKLVHLHASMAGLP